jgi:hypothetical protein
MLPLDEFTQVLAATETGDAAIERIVSYSRTTQGSDAFEDDFSLLEITFQ